MLKALFTRYWNSKVWRNGNESLIAQTHYGDHHSEIIVNLKVKTSSFVIEQASVEKYLSDGKILVGPKDITGAPGLVAYLGNGPQFRKMLDDNGEDNTTVEIFNDAVRAVIQSETFLIKERGFESMQAYSQYWEQMYAGSCKYYSNLDKITKTWYDNVKNIQRGNVLYNRFKSQQLYASGLDRYTISGSLLDPFHTMVVVLEVDRVSKKIINGQVTAPRGLDPICDTVVSEIENLFDHDIFSLTKKQIVNLLGGKQGCVHLIDFVNESVQTLTQYLAE